MHGRPSSKCTGDILEFSHGNNHGKSDLFATSAGVETPSSLLTFLCLVAFNGHGDSCLPNLKIFFYYFFHHLISIPSLFSLFGILF